MSCAIEAKDLYYTYEDGTVALDRISLRAEQGKITGILGANGAGKSTLFLNLNGVLTPKEGAVTVNGRRAVYDRKGIREVRRRVEAAMERTGVSALRDKPTHALSFGQKKRVAIAGVLVMEPSVMILDEPTAGLDPQGVSDIMHLLTELRDSLGMTILIATHDMDIVPLYCDYAYLLSGGRVILEGAPEALFAQPEELRRHHLRLPRIAHLMEILREQDGLDTAPTAATISAARREINRLLQEK